MSYPITLCRASSNSNIGNVNEDVLSPALRSSGCLKVLQVSHQPERQPFDHQSRTLWLGENGKLTHYFGLLCLILLSSCDVPEATDSSVKHNLLYCQTEVVWFAGNILDIVVIGNVTFPDDAWSGIIPWAHAPLNLKSKWSFAQFWTSLINPKLY